MHIREGNGCKGYGMWQAHTMGYSVWVGLNKWYCMPSVLGFYYGPVPFTYLAIKRITTLDKQITFLLWQHVYYNWINKLPIMPWNIHLYHFNYMTIYYQIIVFSKKNLTTTTFSHIHVLIIKVFSVWVDYAFEALSSSPATYTPSVSLVSSCPLLLSLPSLPLLGTQVPGVWYLTAQSSVQNQGGCVQSLPVSFSAPSEDLFASSLLLHFLNSPQPNWFSNCHSQSTSILFWFVES